MPTFFEMKAQQTRRGGCRVVIERSGREVAVPVENHAPDPVAQPATAPLWEHARIQDGAVLVMARACEVSAPEFMRRYV